MLRKRLITVLTFNNGVLFRTRNFIPDYRYTMNFVDAWSVDEIVMLDITRPGQGERENFYEIVNLFSKTCFVPLAVGGGVRYVDDFQTLLDAGADKVVVNTGGLESPDLIRDAAKINGAQCVVVCMDVRRSDGGYEVFAEFGKKATGLSPEEWARKVQVLGAGEVLVQSIEKDGTLEGYDNELNKRVAEVIDIPILVCCGAGRWKHFVEGFNVGKASGVCTQNIYHFTESSIKSAKRFLHNAGIDVRLE